MNIDNEMIRAMQDCDTTKARVSNLYKKSEDLRGFRSWDLHTRDHSLKAAPESIAATKTKIAAKENELVGAQAVFAVLGTDFHSGSHTCEAILVKPPYGEAFIADTPPCTEPAQEFQDYHGHVHKLCGRHVRFVYCCSEGFFCSIKEPHVHGSGEVQPSGRDWGMIDPKKLGSRDRGNA